jgi:16S rRNA (guanine(1405)-N(7))-methyltransferase
MAQADLDQLVSDVCSNSKYARICCELIRKIGKHELEKRGSYKEAIKQTRAKLHQIAASFQEKPIPYGRLFTELDVLPRDLSDPAVQAWCLKTMELHASTRERLPIMTTFFGEILATIQPIHSVLDLACGFNPLAIPWIPLEPGFSYQACDIYEDMNGFLDCFFDHFRIQGNAEICDLSEETPQGEFDLALMLKIIPCLEQLDKNLPQKLLREVDAKHILVSFPVASLGGKGKGMRDNYEKHFLDLTASWTGSTQRFEFYSELAFLLTRDSSA